jgi:hypothetical protein
LLSYIPVPRWGIRVARAALPTPSGPQLMVTLYLHQVVLHALFAKFWPLEPGRGVRRGNLGPRIFSQWSGVKIAPITSAHLWEVGYMASCQGKWQTQSSYMSKRKRRTFLFCFGGPGVDSGLCTCKVSTLLLEPHFQSKKNFWWTESHLTDSRSSPLTGVN